MPNIHPLFTHFPIALLTASLILDTAGLFLKKEQLERAGWWSQLLGTLGLAATVVSGLLAKGTVVFPHGATPVFEMHEQIAFIVSALGTGLLLWRISSRTTIPSKGLFLGLMTLLVALIWIAAWYGGELVYTFGVGVKT